MGNFLENFFDAFRNLFGRRDDNNRNNNLTNMRDPNVGSGEGSGTVQNQDENEE